MTVRGALGDVRAPFRSPPFRLYFAGQLTSAVGDGMVTVALAFAVLEITGSAAALGLVLASRTVCSVAGLLFGGAIADRFSQRPVMVASDAVRFASQGLMAMLLLTGSAEIWQLAVLYGIHGLGGACFMPAVSGLAPQVVPREHLQQANALRWATDAGGDVTGPALAGVIVAISSPGWAVAADSLTFLVSTVTLALLRLPPAPAAPAASPLRLLREGWTEFSSRPWLWVSNIQAAVTNAILLAPMFVLGPIVARSELGGASAWALVLSLMGVGAVAGGILGLSVRPRRPMLVATALFALFAAPLGLLAGGAPAVVIGAAGLVANAGGIVGNVLWETVVQREVPAQALSRVTAYDWFASSVAMPAGYGLAGVLGERLGVHETLWLMFAFGTAVCCLIPALRPVRSLVVEPEAAEITR